MIVCTQCGFTNEDSDAFCGDCGEFLEFVGQKVEAEAPEEESAEVDLVAEEAAAAPVATETETVEETMVEVDEEPVSATAAASPAATSATATAPPPPPAPEPPPAAAAAPEVTPATPSLRDRPAPTSTGTSSAPTEPTSGVTPATPSLRDRPAPAPAAPPADSPAPAKPTTPGPSAPKAAPPQKAPAPRPKPAPTATAPAAPQPGDKICAECGAGNTPQRKFCRSCGTSLVATAPAPVAEEKPPPSLVDKVIGKKEQGPMAAGERPPPKKAKAGMNKAVLVGALVVIGAAAVLLKGAVGGKPTFNPVNPTGAEASSQLPDHPAAHAIDTGSNTFWAEGAEGEGTGQSITVQFAEPFKVGKVGIFPGRSGEEFLAQPRPKDIHLELLDGAGASLGAQDATLNDTADLQLIDVSGDGVSAIRIEIRSVHAGQSGQEASITDLQFFTSS
jgi:hypothetical protein